MAEVLKGKTFTSEAGVLVTGMLEPLDTSDATAAAGDICKGKTAYVNGAKVTGTVAETKSGSTAIANNPQTGNDGTVARIANAIAVTGPNGNDKLIRSGAKVTVAAPAASFGDAAAADVKAGKTFTSQNGVKITGTDTTEFQETWVWNEILTQQSPTFSVAIDFAFYGSSDNLVNCTGFQEVGGALYYNDPDNIVGTVYDVASKQFLGQELRKIIFFEPPTGDLLTYLQANAVKQDPTAAFQEIKGVTITENGAINITPDSPYDGVKNVSVTVNVAGVASSGFSVTFPDSVDWSAGNTADMVFIGDASGNLYKYHPTEVAGKTFTETLLIHFIVKGTFLNAKMTLASGRILFAQHIAGTVTSQVVTAPNTTPTGMYAAGIVWHIPLTDVVLSSLVAYDAD